MRLSYDNFSSYSVRRYSLDETDRSAHPAYTKVVIKPITSSEMSHFLNFYNFEIVCLAKMAKKYKPRVYAFVDTT